jgi:hypothetical protein
MKRLAMVLLILLVFCVQVWAGDDSNTAMPLDTVNPTSPTFGGSTYTSQLYNSLSKEDAARWVEQFGANFVSTVANANACLGGTGVGLSMTPVPCVAYNLGYRSTETGSITFSNNMTTWVAMDENTAGNNPGLPNFTRVGNTHYLINTIDVTQPAMAADSQLLMKVVTAGGSITGVTDLRAASLFTSFTAGPGRISITGNSGNGTDQISGVNVNGVANAATFAGADMGAKVNAAIASMPNGGKVQIPSGNYSFSTTIQCPTTVHQGYIIEGAGSGMSPDVGAPSNTYLAYTGNTDAINQVVTVFANQNLPGCQLRDLTLDGIGAGPSAVGFHFGGVEHGATWNVIIKSFKGAGIEIENGPTNEWTERYDLEGMLWSNTIGINFVVDTGGNASLGHGFIKEWLNVPNNGIGIQVNGGVVNGYDTGQIYSTSIWLNGNIGVGNTGTATVWNITNGGFVAGAMVDAEYECNAATCVEANLNGLYAVFNPLARYARAGGPWTITGTAANYIVIPSPVHHIIAASIPLILSGNTFDIFPIFGVASEGSAAPNGPQQLAMSCGFLNACTSYPTFQLYDVNTSADVAGASITCVSANTVTNSTHISLTPNHSYTVRAATAATGCTGTTNFVVTLDQLW